MIRRSTIDPTSDIYDGAVSEEDYICKYRDTCSGAGTGCFGVSTDEVSGSAHRPLYLEVSQSTYAWSYSYAQDFVLFDFGVKNIGEDRLRRVFMGFYVDADIHDEANQNNGAQDDLNGFREKQPALYLEPPCKPDSDVVNIAWTADNDGDLNQLTPVYQTVPNVTAMRIVRTPSDSLEVSFNWWVSNQDTRLDYGPQSIGHRRVYRHGGTGTPTGDNNKYFLLSNGEFDFDQARTALISNTDSTWFEPPSPEDTLWAKGLDTRYLLSFGPFDIEPGQTLPISLAYVAGMNFHKTGQNFSNLPFNPDGWYEGLNFDSLGSNATWAEWVYDNPGVDTDSDGYAGEFTLCQGGDSTLNHCDTIGWDTAHPPNPITQCFYDYEINDTVWRKGDGVPDFMGATPPPAPSSYSTTDANGVRHKGLRLEASVSQLIVRWNGVRSENTPDVFSRLIDFEGYRVYVARDDRGGSYSTIASYDIQDYNRWEYDESAKAFRLKTSPFTLQQLRCLYAPDSCNSTTWDPASYPRSHPLNVPGVGVYYFTPQDFNRSVLGNEDGALTEIRKTWPDAPKPPVLEPDSIRARYPDTWSDYLTNEGFIKYYEYMYTIDGLLPTVPYWANVTAFDYGSPKSGLEALETSPTLLPEVSYPLDEPAAGDASNAPVFIWPNPYRGDADYRESGYEGRGLSAIPADRVRLIHFANLPEKCTIRIYSLDGDLVRELPHPAINSAYGCAETVHEDCWDLITRNMQQVVSGLYYWTVEDEKGNIQMGKLAIIL